MRKKQNFDIKMVENDNEKIDVLLKCNKAFSELNLEIENEKEWQLKICKYAIVFAAFCGRECCGYIAIYANDNINKEGFITRIGVLPKYQEYGIGKRLLEKGINEAKKRGMKKIALEVLKSNKAAIKFYEKNKFEVVDFYESRNSQYMIKNIMDTE